HGIAVKIQVAYCGIDGLHAEAARFYCAHHAFRHGPLEKLSKGRTVFSRLLAVLESDDHRPRHWRLTSAIAGARRQPRIRPMHPHKPRLGATSCRTPDGSQLLSY